MMVEKRPIGDSGIEVTPLALGGNVFGWTADEATSFRILDAFVDAGGTMIDTADIYSAWVPGHVGGESEAVIGRWLKRDPKKRDKVIIATKVGLVNGLARDVVFAACDASLKRLGIERIDLYYQHKDDESTPLEESLEAFQRLREEAKIRAVGLSQFTPARLRDAVRVAEDGGLTRPCCLQTWYNLVEREKLEGELGDAAAALELSILPFFSLANGFLAGKYRSKADLGKSPRGLRNVAYLEGRGMQVLSVLDELARETGAALATISLAWLMWRPGVSAVLASATSVEQLEELTAAMHLTLTGDQLARLDEASAEALPA